MGSRGWANYGVGGVVSSVVPSRILVKFPPCLSIILRKGCITFLPEEVKRVLLGMLFQKRKLYQKTFSRNGSQVSSWPSFWLVIEVVWFFTLVWRCGHQGVTVLSPLGYLMCLHFHVSTWNMEDLWIPWDVDWMCLISGGQHYWSLLVGGGKRRIVAV